MTRTRKTGALALAATLVLVATPVAAQDDAAAEPAEMAEPDIVVSGVDYAFVGLPTSVPAGTALGFQNDGTEVHEIGVIRILDETTPLEELMAMPDEETEALTEFVGFLFTFPGTEAEGSLVLDSPGRYLALCFIPQGSDPAAFEAVGIDPTTFDPETVDPSTLSPEAQELLATVDSNPPHMDLGMVQEFWVTEEGTEVGPLPEEAEDAADGMDHADADAEPAEEESSE